MEEIEILADLGASATKVICLRRDKKSKLQGLAVMMSPFISVGVSKDFLPDFKSSVEPERQAWVEADGKFFFVGQAAEDYHFEHDIKAPKLEIALKKILAVVWAVGTRLSLGQKFSLSLDLLLPANERKDEDSYQLKQRLADALNSFVTPTGKMQVGLTHYKSMIEGIGSVNLIMPTIQPGKYISTDVNALIVMLGFRNFSVFPIREGRFSNPFTEELGMHYLLERIINKVPGQTVSSLLEPLALARSDFSNSRHLQPCLRSHETSVQKREMEQLIEVAGQVTTMFLQTFQDFIRRHGKLPSTFYWYGGTADYLEPAIRETFPDQDHYFHLGEDCLPLWIISTGHKSRFLDLWGRALMKYPDLLRGKVHA
jgi:hypothetical protein